MPGLIQWLHKQRIAHRTPLGTEAGGNQTAIGLSVGQVDAVALKHGLRHGLGHFLRVGGIADLLQLQSYPSDAGEERLQAELFIAARVFLGFAEQRQQRAEGGIQRAARTEAQLINGWRGVLFDQLLR